MAEGDPQVEYSGSAYLASKFLGLFAEWEVDIGDLTGQDLERIFTATRCQVGGDYKSHEICTMQKGFGRGKRKNRH